MLDQYQELCERTNMALKKFEQACRETQVSAGPVSVRITNQPVFNIDFLEELFEGEDELRNELILTKTTKKVRPSSNDANHPRLHNHASRHRRGAAEENGYA